MSSNGPHVDLLHSLWKQDRDQQLDILKEIVQIIYTTDPVQQARRNQLMQQYFNLWTEDHQIFADLVAWYGIQ